MEQNTGKLRAFISPFNGGFQAQLLELDIAVQGKTFEDILVEFAHAITVHYEIALDLKEAPFASLEPAPMQFQAKWREGLSTQSGHIALEAEVAMALATALRIRNPIQSVVFERRCVAA